MATPVYFFTRADFFRAFRAWELERRLRPDGFTSEEERAAMSVDDYADLCVDNLLVLLGEEVGE